MAGSSRQSVVPEAVYPPSEEAMTRTFDRREFIQLAGLATAGVAGVVFSSGLRGVARAAEKGRAEDFLFLQMSDLHWGFSGPPVNPDANGTLDKAIAHVNALVRQPDFIVFTGDLTHTTDDPAERRTRLAHVRDAVGKLKVKDHRFLAGEHDASLDRAEAYQEFFGATRYTFDHKGVHFIALDNVSDPTGKLGDDQIQWLRADLAQHDKEAPIVVLTHRPLFDLAPDWDWATSDGAGAIEALLPYEHVTVFYGHIHQEHHQMTGHIPHHAAQGLMFPLPAPHSVPKKAPIPWDPANPYRGLGFRSVQTKANGSEYALTEWPVEKE
jgi:3',5'-cyclic AMP phosphodiesterase CpdA